MEKSNYYIGLDVGSDSVGWAVTDENFKLMRLKGKTAWGSRIFDSASDAKERRVFRTSGRRLARRRYRLDLLQRIFAEDITKIDKNFFLRLNESTLIEDDKSVKLNGKLPLFNDNDLEIKYHKFFPTIWHLRYSLLNKNDKNHDFALSDIRFVYLAIHHIIKYRGNFIDDKVISKEAFNELDPEYINCLNSSFSDLYANHFDNDEDEDASVVFPVAKIQEMIQILTNNDLDVKKKKSELTKLFNKNNNNKEFNNYIDLVAALIAGGSYDLSKIYDDPDPKNITFKTKWEENEASYMNIMGDDFDIVISAKKLFDYFYIKNLLDDSTSLSESFIKVYDEHKRDLKELKTILRDIDKKHNTTYFNDIFKNIDNEKGYGSYVGHDSKKGISVEDFNLQIKKILDLYKDEYIENTTFNKLFIKAQNNKLLLIIAHVSNSAIPHQLHQNELDLILDDVKDIYPNLYENKDKILQLFKFIIPYYVGPLNTESPYSSLVKKDGVPLNEKIDPWNFDLIVDKDATRGKFINKLLNKCTYVFNEQVLAKGSMIYQDFMNLDKINNIKDKELMNTIIKLLAFNPNYTLKQLEDAAKNEYRIKSSASLADEISIVRFFSEKEKFSNSTRVLFNKAFKVSRYIGDVPQNPECHEDNSDFDKVERIIEILELFSQDRNDAIQYIKQQFHVNEEQIRVIKQYKCQSWGKLSKYLLFNIYAIDENGECDKKHWIYKEMAEGNGNFMQVLYNKQYHFNVSLDFVNKSRRAEVTSCDSAKQIIEDLPPMMRRSTIQATRIIDEIVKIKKSLPKNIVIEVTRGEDKRKKGKYTTSRREEITNFLKSLKEDIDISYLERINELEEELKEHDDNQLKGKHLYLYFKQLGFDLYTGEKITNISDIMDANKYDIDHIYPQSMIKDDSLDNMVLVSKETNERIKADRYPIPAAIRNKCINLWRFLKKKGAISEEKYSRLTRTTELTEDELTGFVKRQINVLNHSNIAIVQYLKEKYGYQDNEIVLAKSSGASFLRDEYDIPKLRELNDTHHAVDAYLNVVSGIILMNNFTNKFYLAKNKDNLPKFECNFERTLKREIYNRDFISYLNSLNDRHDFLLTYRTSDNDAAFSKLKASKATNNDSLFPLHNNLKTSVYGGYEKSSFEYLIKGTIQDKKGKIKQYLFPIYHYLDVCFDSEQLKDYLEKSFFKKGEKILDLDFNNKIYGNQKVYVQGCQYLLTISNLKQVVIKPITPIFLDKRVINYLTRYKNACEKFKLEFNSLDVNKYEVKDKEGKSIIELSKDENKKILNVLIGLSNDKKYDYCPLVNNIRSLNNENPELNKKSFKMDNYTLFEQYDVLIKVLSLFTRRHDLSGKFSTINFRKTINSLLDDNVYIINDSITGLFTSKRKL